MQVKRNNDYNSLLSAQLVIRSNTYFEFFPVTMSVLLIDVKCY